MGTSIYIQSKIDGKQYCKTNGQFTRHLRSNQLTYQEYYERYVTGIERKCKCGAPVTFYQQSESYAESCGAPVCVGKIISETKQNWTDEERIRDSLNKKKRAASRTSIDKEKTRELRKQTNRERYGVDYTTQSSHMMGKSKLTKKERYGDENYSNPTQTSKTWKAKTIESINELSNKKRNTCRERYGVENTFLMPEVKAKSASSNSKGKEFTLPSGRVIRVRGNEDLAITQLLCSYAEDELVIHDSLVDYALPIFRYTDNRKHVLRYYPDIYIPKENKIIEVKGRWWWDGNGRTEEKYINRLNKNLNKRQAVIASGYKYEVWLYEDRDTYRILKNDTDFVTE